ncbi:hypothetical protein [Mucilaginibacter paludis]|uniref:Uncharacterized protein n=1 Tax=Mucilaginibacter paludis DSM 18603 TaxID=714943 RepID=H1YHN8_9SPHI|nr:hypothetical protein [Mucilaginibacter paludis]EHQ26461.1 hypothetical protein Mucpa_2331 [Mucilaginibacter paludis DSM 18603]
MTWLQFILWVTGVYFLYYLAIILLDLKGGKARAETGKAMSYELSFSEPVAAEKVEHPTEPLTAQNSMPRQVATETPPPPPPPERKPEPDNVASGGVTLKNLFNLVREEAILYTRPVNFQT